MFEVYRDIDATKVGLYDGVLRSAGIETMIRNWNAVSMTTEIPIPVMYPNIVVFNQADFERARAIIKEAEEAVDLPDWQCPHCGADNDGAIAECWQCQRERDVST